MAFSDLRLCFNLGACEPAHSGFTPKEDVAVMKRKNSDLMTHSNTASLEVVIKNLEFLMELNFAI